MYILDRVLTRQITDAQQHCCLSLACIQVRPAKANALQICELDKVKHWLGISAGGTNALLLIALLVGGDYHHGAEKVGMRSAFAAVKHLLRNKQVRLSLHWRIVPEEGYHSHRP